MQSLNKASKCGVVIILYYPTSDTIKHVTSSLYKYNIYLIDNTPKNDIKYDLNDFNNIVYIKNNENKGVAFAQNVGIKKAINDECEYVALFDQDSLLSDELIYALIQEYTRIENSKYKIGVLGPLPINLDNNQPYKQRVLKKIDALEVFSTDMIISSGMVVKSSIFERVGLMDDDLFIDGVDFEFCWRLQKAGFKCFITYKVELFHKVGKDDASFMGFPIIISSPVRYYYMYRNYFKLAFRYYVPLSWKLKNLVKRMFFLLYALTLNDKKNIYRNILKGVIDGINKK